MHQAQAWGETIFPSGSALGVEQHSESAVLPSPGQESRSYVEQRSDSSRRLSVLDKRTDIARSNPGPADHPPSHEASTRGRGCPVNRDGEGKRI